ADVEVDGAGRGAGLGVRALEGHAGSQGRSHALGNVEEGIAARGDRRDQAVAIRVDEGGLEGILDPPGARRVEVEALIGERQVVRGRWDGEVVAQTGVEGVALGEDVAAAVEDHGPLAAARAAGLEGGPAGIARHVDDAGARSAWIDNDAVGDSIGIPWSTVYEMERDHVALDLGA